MMAEVILSNIDSELFNLLFGAGLGGILGVGIGVLWRDKHDERED